MEKLNSRIRKRSCIISQKTSSERSIISSKSSKQIGIDNINDSMVNCLTLMQENAKHSVSRITHIIRRFTTWPSAVNQWLDCHDLNLLHHCILYNKPELVQYLFDHGFFGEEHTPLICPYAHLAAFLGHETCLELILEYRPDDFFVSSTPRHDLRIPGDIVKKLKIDLHIPLRVNKNAESILEKIKSTHIFVGSELEQDALIAEFKSELMKVEQKQTDFHRNVSRKSFHLIKGDSDTGRQIKLSKSRHRDSSTERFRSEIEVVKFEAVNTDQYNRNIKVKPGENRITVYSDVFDSRNQGVLQGAGLPARIKKMLHDHTIVVRDSGIQHQALFMPRTSRYGSQKRKSTILQPILQRQDSASGSKINSSCRRSSLAIPNKEDTQQRLTPTSSERENIYTACASSVKISPSAHVRSSLKNVLQESPSHMPPIRHNRTFEFGVRGVKKFKEFSLKIESRVLPIPVEKKFMNKTPLTLAAEKRHLECVQIIFKKVLLKRHPVMTCTEPLSLAVKADSPESIFLLMEKRFSHLDFQSAVLQAIRDKASKCLLALLSSHPKEKERKRYFEGKNLFHILYTQSLVSAGKEKKLSEMTSILLENQENVNDHSVPRTYPIYTLINCAFQTQSLPMIFEFLECLRLLLQAKANTRYNEETMERCDEKTMFCRKGYTSAVECLFINAKNSSQIQQKFWTTFFLRKFIYTLESYDRTPRALLNNELFDYMNCICELGLDRVVVRSLLRYGANPQFKIDNRYAVNLYFDNLLPFLSKFEVINSYETYKVELDSLFLLVQGMCYKSQMEALDIFLDSHILHTPLQGLPVVRYFSYLMKNLLMQPRSLTELVALLIWNTVKRNVKRARLLPLSDVELSLVIP